MLTVDVLKECVVEGIKGFEAFYKQFDVFHIKLTRHSTGNVPFVMLSVELHEPIPSIKDGELGPVLQNKILELLRFHCPNILFEWEGGFSGGNPRGWDMWRSLSLGNDNQGNQIQFDGDVTLFLHETGRVYPLSA